MNIRFDEKNLRLRRIVEGGKLISNPKWKAVKGLEPIVDTRFPDVKGISLGKRNHLVPAEVKYRTSKFDYHSKSKFREEFEIFKSKGGCVIVLAHDYMPKNLSEEALDVWEIDFDDFTTFCRENFSRLLNRQIRGSIGQRYWIMYQGPNFNQNQPIEAARESKIWCPTNNMSGFDLAEGDRVIFVKTRGASGFKVQPAYHNYKSDFEQNGRRKNWPKEVKSWILEEVYIAEVKSAIYSREEYCAIKKIQYEKQLWNNDKFDSETNRWTQWTRVFEFRKVSSASVNKPVFECFSKSSAPFIDQMTESFCYSGTSRELSAEQYLQFIESLHLLA